jgi:hypothetical protein
VGAAQLAQAPGKTQPTKLKQKSRYSVTAFLF